MLPNIISHQNKLGLYVHWPFCVSKCPYCDFNSHIQMDLDIKRWRLAYISELRWMAKKYKQNVNQPAVIYSVFFGGGTPSLMPTCIMEAILDTLEELFIIHPEIEITAEANPSSSEIKNLSAFKKLGVNRLSLGAQSLNQNTLNFLERGHNIQDIYSALDVASELFGQISADFIYGIPDQSKETWKAELTQILKLGLSHISAYQLTIEPGTQFFTRSNKGEILSCDDKVMSDLYRLTNDVLTNYGYETYEISNYAKPNAQCLHNLLYWNAQDWIGIGPGAHGRFSISGNRRWYSQIRRSPDGWLSAVQKNLHGVEIQDEDDEPEFAKEIILMGLRLSSGIYLPDWLFKNTGFLNLKWLKQFEEDGLIATEDNHIRVTEEGRLHLNSIIYKLLN